MKATVISVTEAARNFADCVNRAHYQGVTFVLVKNGMPMARIMPHEGKACTGTELAEALRDVKLSAENAKAWHRDLQKGRKILKAPEDKWR
jgi:antitoxin (DNA-binding transcriptional repressor) of toxin-antitoxin stability system